MFPLSADATTFPGPNGLGSIEAGPARLRPARVAAFPGPNGLGSIEAPKGARQWQAFGLVSGS